MNLKDKQMIYHKISGIKVQIKNLEDVVQKFEEWIVDLEAN